MDATATQGLRTYTGLVAAGLGVPETDTIVTMEPPPARVYVALSGHLPHYPEHAPALTWDQRHGWAAAVETECSELVPLVWLGETVLPAPWAVVRFTTMLYADQHPRQPRPPSLRTTGSELLARLAAYASEQPRRN